MAGGVRIVQTVRGEQALTVRESINVGRSVADAFRLWDRRVVAAQRHELLVRWRTRRQDLPRGETGGRLYGRFTDGEEFECRGSHFGLGQGLAIHPRALCRSRHPGRL